MILVARNVLFYYSDTFSCCICKRYSNVTTTISVSLSSFRLTLHYSHSLDFLWFVSRYDTCEFYTICCKSFIVNTLSYNYYVFSNSIYIYLNLFTYVNLGVYLNIYVYIYAINKYIFSIII